jgi:hypothetical protein
MCPGTLVFFLVFGAILIICVGQFWKFSSSVDQSLGGLGGQRTGMYSGTFNCEGRSANFYYYPGSKNRSSELKIFVDGPFSANCVIRREGGADAFAKDIGLNREIQLNDPAWDARLYFECDDQAFVQEFMRSADAKEAVKGLLADFNSFEISGSRCAVVKRPCSQLSSVDTGVMSAAAAQLVKLSTYIPASYGGSVSATPQTDEFKSSQNLFTGFSVGFFIVGILLSLWGTSSFEPLQGGRVFFVSLWFSLPLSALFLAYACHELAGHSTSARAFFGSAVFAIIGLVLSGWGGAVVLNGSLDSSLRESHRTAVYSKRITHHKSSTYYKVTVEGWGPGSSGYEFTVSPYTYDQINPGDPCEVTTRQGAFGFQWVVAHDCTPAERP